MNLMKSSVSGIRVALCLTAAVSGVLAGPQARAAQASGTVVGWGGQGILKMGPDVHFTAIAAGLFYSLALKPDGTVVAWGDNYLGATSVPAALSNVIAIAAGYGESLALKSNGTVVAWGDNALGQGGLPADLRNVVAIAAGGDPIAGSFCLALKSDGTVVARGSNSYGQTNVPAGLHDVIAIAAGISHSLALTSNGTVVAWGDNSTGQSTVPPGLDQVIAVAAGGWHNVALRADGTVVAWGRDAYGDLDVPVGLSGVVAVAAGDAHSLALRSDGTVVAWGSSFNGATDVPAGLQGVFAIAARWYNNLALVADPTVRPASQTAETGSRVTFSVGAPGYPAMVYQWFFEGTNALTSPTTNSILTLNNVQPGDCGAYTVVASNGAVAVASSPALLNVIAPVQRSIVPGINVTGDTGSTLEIMCADSWPDFSAWFQLGTVNLSNGSNYYFDVSTSLPAQRFYRARQVGDPVLPPSLAAKMVPALTLMGGVGSSVRLDGINAIGPTDAWFTLATVTLTNTSQLYFDVSAPGQPERLYRVVQVP